eukprot:7545560-Ditylum_brightwellii.AAC.1
MSKNIRHCVCMCAMTGHPGKGWVHITPLHYQYSCTRYTYIPPLPGLVRHPQAIKTAQVTIRALIV